MNRHLNLIFLVTLCLLFIQPAQAMHLSLVGLADISKQSTSPSTTSLSGNSVSFSDGSKTGFGGGALLGFGFLPFTEIETGALYITRKYSTSASATVSGSNFTETQDYSQHALQIPLLFRVHLTHYFSLGAGGYAAIGTGDVNMSSNGTITNNGTAYSKSGTYSTLGLKNKDYGLLFSGSVQIPVSIMTSFLVDARYALGLTDVNADPSTFSPAVSYKYRDVQILAGLRFGI